MRLIDADVFKKNMDYVCTMGGWLEPISSAITEYVKKHIDAQTTVDAVSVVRCKECKHYRVYDFAINSAKCCYKHDMWSNDDDYCAWGERRYKETDHE